MHRQKLEKPYIGVHSRRGLVLNGLIFNFSFPAVIFKVPRFKLNEQSKINALTAAVVEIIF